MHYGQYRTAAGGRINTENIRREGAKSVKQDAKKTSKSFVLLRVCLGLFAAQWGGVEPRRRAEPVASEFATPVRRFAV
jgi:hypothetical protein